MANENVRKPQRDDSGLRHESGAGTPGEFELIRRVTKHLPSGRGVIVGPGDDAAVLRPDDALDLVVTTDAITVNRHIRRDWFHDAAKFAEAIGTRLAAANLSDLAAMAALPRWAVLSAGFGNDDVATLEIAERRLAEMLDRDGAALVGGNLTRVEGPAWFSLTLIGEVERGRAWTRRGAREGDLIAFTGSPGRAGALERYAALRSALSGDAFFGTEDESVAAWLRPPSRVAAARAMANSGAVRAAIDISDGFRGDLAHLCEASGVGAEIEIVAWPAEPLFQTIADSLPGAGRHTRARVISGDDAERNAIRDANACSVDELRFGPSDDYELLLAIDPAQRDRCAEVAESAGAPLRFVGRFTGAPGVLTLVSADGPHSPLPGAGFDHFVTRGMPPLR